MKPHRATRSTIKDVAGACGVSEATVSYVINGKRTLKPATREKIFRAMREMNYHPSALARGLSSKRVQTLGVLFGAVGTVDFITNSYVNGLLMGIMECSQREGFDVTLFTAKWENAQRSALPLGDGRTGGVLAIAPTLTSDIIEGISGLNIPLVAVSADARAAVTNVDVDNFEGARMAAQHLLEFGHRRIAYLCGNDDLASFAPRRAGFRAALKAARVREVPGFVQLSHFDGSLAFEQTIQLLQRPKPPTAIFAGSDVIALGVLEAARALGVAVPQQLSVIGFDDIPAALFVSPTLTTIRQPLRAIGAAAASFLIEFMRGAELDSPQTQLFPPELIARASTAPAAL